MNNIVGVAENADGSPILGITTFIVETRNWRVLLNKMLPIMDNNLSWFSDATFGGLYGPVSLAASILITNYASLQ